MANEAQIIPQPDSTPGAVSTGYQAQNTLSEAIRNGIDYTAPYASSTTEVTLPPGGPIDYNGILCSVTSATTLTPATVGLWHIYLAGAGPTTYTPTLTSDSGTYDATKNARYLGTGERVFNWIIEKKASEIIVRRWFDPSRDDVLFKNDAIIKHDLTVENDLTVEGDASVTGDSTFTGDIYQSGALYATVISSGSVTIAGGGEWTIPRGRWGVRGNSGYYACDNAGNIASSVLFSDGSQKLRNTSGTSYTYYYWQF